MNSNPLIWGLGPFQSCVTIPFVSASEASSSLQSDDQIFSNGKLLTFGFAISPAVDSSEMTAFFDEFKDHFDHLILSYQLIHERKGVLLSKSVESRGAAVDGSDKLSIFCMADKLYITASSRFKVSPMHLQKSLTLSLSLEFSFSRLTSARVLRAQNGINYQIDDDEKDIRNAIENPKYKPQRVTPRKGKIMLSFIEPLEITVKNKECGPESTLIYISIANNHPQNDLLLFSVNLSMNSTVRDFDGDSAKIAIRGPRTRSRESLSFFEREGMEGLVSQRESVDEHEHEHSVTSTDEGNVEEYLRIIRADRYFHVTEVIPKPRKDCNPLALAATAEGESDFMSLTRSDAVQYEEKEFIGLLRIKSGCSHSFSYRISAKNASNLVVGNFLTPLGIRYIDVHVLRPQATEQISPIYDGNSESSYVKKRQSHLSSSSQVAWSIGTQYLNRSAFCRDVHVYNLESGHLDYNSRFHGLQRQIDQDDNAYEGDLSDQILIAIDGPTTASVNTLFQVLVRTTNLCRTAKHFSLGIQEKNTNGSSSSALQFLAIEAVTKLRELRYGDTVESVINILPLRIGELVLDGFYLEESHDRAESALGSVYPSGAGAVKTIRAFANSFPVNIV